MMIHLEEKVEALRGIGDPLCAAFEQGRYGRDPGLCKGRSRA